MPKICQEPDYRKAPHPKSPTEQHERHAEADCTDNADPPGSADEDEDSNAGLERCKHRNQHVDVWYKNRSPSVLDERPVACIGKGIVSVWPTTYEDDVDSASRKEETTKCPGPPLGAVGRSQGLVRDSRHQPGLGSLRILRHACFLQWFNAMSHSDHLTSDGSMQDGGSSSMRMPLSLVHCRTDRDPDPGSKAEANRNSPATDQNADCDPDTCAEGHDDARVLTCLFMCYFVTVHRNLLPSSSPSFDRSPVGG